jgi:hypothetical protein
MNETETEESLTARCLQRRSCRLLAVDALGRLEQAAGASAWEGDGGGAAAPPVTSDEVVAAPEKVAEAAV